MGSITTWMRLEPRCRNDDMSAGLQARIYDPLWLLARQWQIGEFDGDDAGSPAMARFKAETSGLTRFHPGSIAPNTRLKAAAYSGAQTPLEPLVEREVVRPAEAAPARAEKLRLAIESGIYFLRLLDQQTMSRSYRDSFIQKYSLPPLTDDQRAEIDAIVEQAWSTAGCYGARVMGAGFGGSILALVQRTGTAAFEKAMARPVLFCSTADGAYARRARAGRTSDG